MLPLFKSKVHRGCYCLHALAALLNVVYKSNRREGGRHLKLCEIKKSLVNIIAFITLLEQPKDVGISVPRYPRLTSLTHEWVSWPMGMLDVLYQMTVSETIT